MIKEFREKKDRADELKQNKDLERAKQYNEKQIRDLNYQVQKKIHVGNYKNKDYTIQTNYTSIKYK